MEGARLSQIDGYFFQGWESVGGDDFIKGRTLPILGDQWKMTLKKAEDGTLRRETPPRGL
tara:strand:- start:250 stop:429 length:180 start_codon:yes stop_codon:yes gene_type:complete